MKSKKKEWWIKRHGVPCTVTSTGRVVRSWTPGPANRLRGLNRYREVWARLRNQWRLSVVLRLMVSLWRHGFVLSGGPVIKSLHCKVKREIAREDQEWKELGLGG